jgi:DnaJ homolog subfamily A member 2
VAGHLFPQQTTCNNCRGTGKVYRDKDKCKLCKGNRTVEKRKHLELYIPPGSRQGDRIVLQGEGDQEPGQQPGDVIFDIVEESHDTFKRAGNDLAANIDITLAEALTGFHRVVLTHLDGRGIQICVSQPHGRILKPDQVLKVVGEGMPIKRSASKGDLFMTVKIKFPEDGWLRDTNVLKGLHSLLPKSDLSIPADVVDEVMYDPTATLEDFGAGSGDPRGGDEWEDEEDDDNDPQCAYQ